VKVSAAELETFRMLPRRIDSVCVHASLQTMASIEKRLGRVQQKFVREFVGKNALILEVKRRVAEARYRCATSGKRSLVVVRNRFRALEELGFSNVEMCADFHELHARWCIDHGHREAAIHTMEQLVTRLKKNPRARSNRQFRKGIRHYISILNEFKTHRVDD
jgi:hypothetical protein